MKATACLLVGLFWFMASLLWCLLMRRSGQAFESEDGAENDARRG